MHFLKNFSTMNAALLLIMFSYFNSNAQEQINTREYGGRANLGVALGGGGIIGVPLRSYMNEKAAFEMATYYRPIIIIGGNRRDSGGPMFAGGFNFFANKRYVPNKRTVSMHGVFFKGGYGFSQLTTAAFIGLGWVYERFSAKNKKCSFVMELGPAVFF